MPFPDDITCYIAQSALNMRKILVKGELGEYIADSALTYGMYDLQQISGKIERDLRSLPPPYRIRIRPFMRDWVFSRYHTVVSMHHSGAFHRLSGRITDLTTFQAFCDMIPDGCMIGGDSHDPYPPEYTPRFHFFMYLMSAFAMFVMDEPGHPVGMPFPGGETVRKQGDVFYCPIREKEEEIFYSICNFCPALQEPDR